MTEMIAGPVHYRPEIDGLRAVAVLPVILFHAGIPPFSGGFVGVDVFFVISGYLITQLIINERAKGTFSLLDFYERRARRIIPALYVVLACSAAAAWAILLPGEMADFSRSLLYVPLFASNIHFWKTSGYFDAASELKPLLHTWSLAVEEQYYLLFPVALLIVWKIWRSRLATVFLAAGIASLALAHIASYKAPSAAFYLLPTRAWELLLGAFCAIHLSGERGKKSHADVAAWVGLLAIVASTIVFDERMPSPGLWTLIPTAGTAAIIVYGQQSSVRHALSLQPIVGIGLISYSAYLWHQPILAFARHHFGQNASGLVLAAGCAGALVMAYATWRFIETPTRNRALCSRAAIWSITALCGIALVAFGAAGRYSNGFETHYYANRLTDEQRAVYDALREHNAPKTPIVMKDDGDCVFSDERPSARFVERFTACFNRHGPGFVILGDSHAMNIFNALAISGRHRFQVGLIKPGCRPQDPNAATCHFAEIESFLKLHASRIHLVIFHQSGSYLLTDRAGRHDSNFAFASSDSYILDAAAIERVSAWLGKLGGVSNVVWLGPFPEARVDFRNIDGFIRHGFKMNPHSLSAFRKLDSLLQSLPARRYRYLSMYSVADFHDGFLQQGQCITYRDIDHLSSCGEALVGPVLAEKLSTLAGPR